MQAGKIGVVIAVATMKVIPRSPVRRPADRQDEILSALRDRIVSGALASGERLPTRLEIEKQFGASPVTVQRALQRLKAEGFVTASRGDGTYVAQRLPHLTRYALVFPEHPAHEGSWNRFWTTLSDEAKKIEALRGIEIALFYGIDGREDEPDFQRLLGEAATHRLAGVICAHNVGTLSRTPLLRDKEIPAVAIGTGSNSIGVPDIVLNYASFLDRALEYLAGQGRRRLAMICAAQVLEPFSEYLAQRAAKHGMETREHWWQPVALNAPETAKSYAQLLMHEEQTVRPDALIIADDNFVEHASAGMLAAGIRVPHDVEIVAHCNFPAPSPSVLPARRLGFDVRDVLLSSLDSIDAERSQQPTMPIKYISARFEDEVSRGAASRTRKDSATPDWMSLPVELAPVLKADVLGVN